MPKKKKETILLDNDGVTAIIEKIADDIVKKLTSSQSLAIVGVRTRGAILAERLRKLLELKLGQEIPLGVVDITLYRDDLDEVGEPVPLKETQIDFDLTDTKLILVDDVLLSGRTIRAALEILSDFGRPAFIKLAVFIDRGFRELPIAPDFVGMKLKTRKRERVNLNLEEIDGIDMMALVPRE